MIDVARERAILLDEGLDDWASIIEDQLAQVLELAPHGDWARWRQALGLLPDDLHGTFDVHNGALNLHGLSAVDKDRQTRIESALQMLHPWRKGPFSIAGIEIDTEWRSDWKWARIEPYLEALDNRLVLDVGCGNGYYCWRLAMAGARRVIGIDPTALFLAQFLAITKLIAPSVPALVERISLLPLGIEAVPQKLERFDTVLSMGVFYHRRSPIDHLMKLRSSLRRHGQLVLETLVIAGGERDVLVPAGRYAKMRNVWFIPSTAALTVWMARAGFDDIRVVDVTRTSRQEQRSTAWMRFESLADFLDPADREKTIEGYPAPRRAVLIARAK